MNRYIAASGRRMLIAAIAVATLAAVSAVFAQDAQAPAPTAEVPAAATVTKSAPVAPSAPGNASDESEAVPVVRKRPLSPMMVEIRTVLEAEAAQVAELRQRAAKAGAPDEALALQREIEKLKFDTEVTLLRVQAKHARANGRTEVAARIEAAISELLNPPRIEAPAARPVPSRENPSR